MPTAVHVAEDEQDTPYRMDPYERLGLGMRWIVHFAPFHLSASAVVPGACEYPTAVHAFAELQDRP
jgi:hypothetical protein